MKKKGFTLAEVLITLAIIGVVAAITIPSVIANTQQQEYKTGLKKAVSVLNSAITMAKTITSESPYDNSDLINYLRPHMSIIKEEGYEETTDEDLRSETNDSNFAGMRNKAFYTTDGMRFEFPNVWSISANVKTHETGDRINMHSLEHGGLTAHGYCGSYGIGDNPNNTTSTPCVILVDVNGDRKPTLYGTNTTKGTDGKYSGTYKFPKVTDKRLTDLFLIMVTEDKAVPFGVIAQRAMYDK